MAGIFSRFIFNNAIFNTGGGETPVVTTGGVADYKHYRNQLKKIAQAADRRLYGKIEKKIIKLAKNAPAPIVEVVEEIKSQIDFAKLAQEQSQEVAAALNILLQKLDKLVADALILERQREDDEDLILMMVAV